MSDNNLKNRRILCVDDEPNVLAGLERTLYERYEVCTATSGAAGLEKLKTEGPFAVVISDMRMPQMDGAAFLSRVRETSPDTVRILLTGYTELDSAIAAVNEGNIFRFLCKPCPVDILLNSVKAAAEQYRLVTAEHDLLQNTLNGAIKVLTQALSLASPVAFSRSGQVKSYVARMAKAVKAAEPWQYEIAAMLSQLGCITLPPKTLQKIYSGEAVTENEQKIYNSHPGVGYRLLAQIPRMEQVAEMVRDQWVGEREDDTGEKLGSEMLRIALAVDRLVTTGISVDRARAALEKKGGYRQELLDALIDFETGKAPPAIKSLPVRKLCEGMILADNVLTLDGAVIIGKGIELHMPQIERLRHFLLGAGIVEPIRVRIPENLSVT